MVKRSGFISQIPASQELVGFSLCFYAGAPMHWDLQNRQRLSTGAAAF
jgi:hypothetical protein